MERMDTRETRIFTAIFMTILTAVFTFAVMKINVGIAGETQTEVGLVKLNTWFNDLLGGVNEKCYEISKYMGYIAFVVLGIFALIGLIQLIQRKSLLKVDREIFGMGILYLVTLAFYFASSHIVINYRPVIAPGETQLESSYPSSHTVMGVVICFSTLLIVEKYVKGAWLPIVKAFLGFLMAMIIFNRAMSGTHWLTDIIGGVIFACTLVAWFYALFCEPKDVFDKEAFEREMASRKASKKNTTNSNSRPNSGGKHFKKLSR